mgnify:CR=1 FL=1
MNKYKTKQILLVEPAYRAEYPPLGLMKISTWHKKKGDNVQFFKDIKNIEERDKFDKRKKHFHLLKDHYDIIYITSLFTYNSWQVAKSAKYFQEKYPNADVKIGGIAATLVPEYFKKKTGISPYIGLLNGAENCQPDYTLFPYLKCSITFTTRGCPRKCPFCGVIKHEPKFFVKEDWPKDIDITKNSIIFWDNNWLLSPNIENDVERILEFQKIGISYVDFNQGLDCRLFTEEKAKLLSRINIKPLRFAFDNHSEDGYIQKAIEIAQKYGFKDIRVYVLYNFESDEDTPEYFYYRINETVSYTHLTLPTN